MKIAICIVLIVKSLCDANEAVSAVSKANINDVPTLVMNAIEFYIEKVKSSGEDILGNDTEFFNEINKLITQYKEQIDLKSKIEIVKKTMNKLKEKFISIDSISALTIFPIWDNMINQYEQLVIKEEEKDICNRQMKKN